MAAVTHDFGTSDYLISGGRLIGRRLMEVQLSMVRKTPKFFLWDGVWVLTVYNRFDQNVLGEMNLCK